MLKKVMKIAIPAVIVIAIVFTLLHFLPFTKNMDIKMDGTVRNADGDLLSSCSINLDGKEYSYLLGNKADVLKGSMELTGDFETISSHTIHLSTTTLPEKNPDGSDNPFKNLVYRSGFRYDEKTNSSLTFCIFSTVDGSAHVVVDNGTIYCFSTLEEAKFLEVFERIKQFAVNDLTLNPA